jgi:uncharacterized cysteine cluster protein YcgN (CxxCxxCC family)
MPGNLFLSWIMAAMRVRMQNGSTKKDEHPFWQTKRLEEMSRSEWEQLCDGCGRCCMLKLEDEDTGDIYLTRLSCKLLNIGLCQCTNYKKRHEIVTDCLSLTPSMVRELSWLPDTCAYRLVDEGVDLAWWHPLVSGSDQTVHEAGISVQDWAMPETAARAEALHEYLVIDEE